MRQVFPFNDWYYKDSFSNDDLKNESFKDFKKVTIPHTNKEIPFNYFDEKETMFISCYRKKIIFKPEWKDRRIFIKFYGVSSVADVYLNGKHLGCHKGAYTAFEYELTGYLHKDKDNIITVKVDSTERNDVPPFGHLIDYLCYGGIYRDVELIVSDDIYIRDMHLTPLDVLKENKKLAVKLYLDSLQAVKNAQVNILFNKENRSFIADVKKGKNTVEFELDDLKADLWSIDNPVLYEVEVELNGNIIKDKTGFRTVKFLPDGFYLNEEKIKLCGLNRHQSYPYVGYAMPKRAQEKDAEILNDLGINIVRTSHYPQSRYFLNRCDELGLLVFEEIPGWQYIGDEKWKKLALKNVEDMINEGYNHPSIILWGVRINESDNDFDFYEETNRIAHELDKTRPTGGVKYMEKADFQEDVYVMNEFELGKRERKHIDQNMATGLDHDVPFLISEFVGAWHPTKRYDTSAVRADQALRHAYGHDESMLDDRLCGAIAWCAFDYNTHYQFGPGDRVCYHGIFDMFRIPKKYATAVYESQLDPHVKPVLEPAIVWSNGDIDECGFLPMYIFSNCDYVEFYFGDKMGRRLYPYKRLFAGLKHAPMYLDRVDREVYNRWDWLDASFVGYVDGKEVIRKKYAKDPMPKKLRITPDDLKLCARKKEEAYDVTRVVFEALDQYGNVLDYMFDWIEIKVEGGELIGPDKTNLQGGCLAAWVKADKKGVIKISARTAKLKSDTVKIKVE
ncbi:MAG: glycoside hydrolase family 2 [Erysipelotrichaceae bacterium]|nr:glycoside hydrolase family 2 [Erysipelotrichaceae bacterium]